MVSESPENVAAEDKPVAKVARTTGDIHDALDLKLLLQLREYFYPNGEDKDGVPLSEEEFIGALSETLGIEASSTELRNLFMKIDANSDGGVDWDEFTSFLLFIDQSNQTITSQQESLAYSKVAHEIEDSDSSFLHKDPIQCMCILRHSRASKVLVTGGRDGFIKFWTGEFYTQGMRSLNHGAKTRSFISWNERSSRMKSTVRTASKPRSQSPQWPLHLVHMHSSNLLAVASSDRSIAFYSLDSFEIEHRMANLEALPCALEYVCSKAEAAEYLVAGDTTGSLRILKVSPKFRLPAYDHKWVDGDSFPEDGVLSYKVVRNVHKDWISSLVWVQDIELLLCCGLDSNISMFEMRKWIPTRTFKGHLRGVCHAAWHRYNYSIVSCGLDRLILVWNPYTCEVIVRIMGHTSAVLSVHVDEANQNFISVGVDRTIKVWNTFNYRLKQTIIDRDASTFRQERDFTTALWDEEQDLPSKGDADNVVDIFDQKETVVGGKLLAAGMSTAVWARMQRQARGDSGTLSHEGPVVATVFNHNFGQVVSADSDKICVWNVETGALVFQFTDGDSKFSSIAFDTTARRLLTSSQNGETKMWNFSNGQELCAYHQSDQLRVASDQPVMKRRRRSARRLPDNVDVLQVLTSLFSKMYPNARHEQVLQIRSKRSRELEAETKAEIAAIMDDMRKRFLRRQRIMMMTNDEGLNSPSESGDEGEISGLRSHEGSHTNSLPNEPESEQRSHLSHYDLHGDDNLFSKSEIDSISVTSKRPLQPMKFVRNAEISTVLFIEHTGGDDDIVKRYILSCGWDKKIRIYYDRPELLEANALRVMPQVPGVGHDEEILCAADCGHQRVACGSFDGMVIVWGIDTGRSKLYLDSSNFMITRDYSKRRRRTKVPETNAGRATALPQQLDKLADGPPQERVDTSLHPDAADGKVTLKGRERSGRRLREHDENSSSDSETSWEEESTIGSKSSSSSFVGGESNSREEDAASDVNEDARCVDALLFIRKFRALISATADGYLRFWSLRDGTLYSIVNSNHPHRQSVRVMALLDDKSTAGPPGCYPPDEAPLLVATGCAGGVLKLWEIQRLTQAPDPREVAACEFRVLDRERLRRQTIETLEASERLVNRKSLKLATGVSSPTTTFEELSNQRRQSAGKGIRFPRSSPGDMNTDSDSDDETRPMYHSFKPRRAWRAHDAGITAVTFICSRDRKSMYTRPKRMNLLDGQHRQPSGLSRRGIIAFSSAKEDAKASAGDFALKRDEDKDSSSENRSWRARRGVVLGSSPLKPGVGFFRSNLSEAEEKAYYCPVLAAEESGVMVLTGSEDFKVCLWTVLGAKIGVFGHFQHWSLLQPMTWASPVLAPGTVVYDRRGELVSSGVLFDGTPTKMELQLRPVAGALKHRHVSEMKKRLASRPIHLRVAPVQREDDALAMSIRRDRKVSQARREFFSSSEQKVGKSVAAVYPTSHQNYRMIDQYRGILLRERFHTVYQQLAVYALSTPRLTQARPRAQKREKHHSQLHGIMEDVSGR